MKKTLVVVTFCSLILAIAFPASAQTFEIQGQPEKPSSASPASPATSRKKGPAAKDSGGGIGWGSSIDVGRMARAAEDALKKGNYAAASNFAERAVKAAPQNAKLWFLFGYASQLAGHYQASLEGYQRGLGGRAQLRGRPLRHGPDVCPDGDYRGSDRYPQPDHCRESRCALAARKSRLRRLAGV